MTSVYDCAARSHFDGIALRLVEEELAEREVRVGDVLRLRRLLDELVVDLARVLESLRLLVLVGEVVEHLVASAE